MKRKVKRYDSGGNVKTRSDDEIEWANSKPMGGAGQQYPGEGWKQREKEQGEKNLKAFKNFFGMKEAPKSVDSEPVGDANKSSSYNTRAKSEEAPTRKIEDYIKKSEPEEPYKPTGKTYVNEGYKEEPAPKKKIVAKKAAPKAAPKASMDAGIPKDTKSTRMPSGYENLDPRSPQEKSRSMGQGVIKYEKGRSMSDWSRNLGKKPESDEEDKPSRSIFATKSPNRSYKSGGSVKSASARADGCAIRGKTRA
jgi:hypothetical protein